MYVKEISSCTEIEEGEAILKLCQSSSRLCSEGDPFTYYGNSGYNLSHCEDSRGCRKTWKGLSYASPKTTLMERGTYGGGFKVEDPTERSIC